MAKSDDVQRGASARVSTARLYTDLAWLWPYWGDAAVGYADYCAHVVGMISRYSRGPVGTLLNLGCGGGKNVFNLKQRFEVTGVDLSPVMLEQAARLNPECRFVEGDMRTLRLGVQFDAVLMDDAISCMACLGDFEAALRTAHAHLRPGGVLVVTPDTTVETFCQNRTTVTPGQRLPEGLDVVFVENNYDPDGTDEHYETTVVYLIREHGRLRIESDHWLMGLFPLDTWRRVLREIGFALHEVPYRLGDETYTVFACVRR